MLPSIGIVTARIVSLFFRIQRQAGADCEQEARFSLAGEKLCHCDSFLRQCDGDSKTIFKHDVSQHQHQ